jgi:hypothetical protein
VANKTIKYELDPLLHWGQTIKNIKTTNGAKTRVQLEELNPAIEESK